MTGIVLFIIFVDQYIFSAGKQLLGIETVYSLRSQEFTSIISGLSANDLESAASLLAGADAFLMKPFLCNVDEWKSALTNTHQGVETFHEKE